MTQTDETDQATPYVCAGMPGYTVEQTDAELAERVARAVTPERGAVVADRLGRIVARAYSGGRLIDAGDVAALKRVAMVTDLDQLNDDQLDRLVWMCGDGADGALVDPAPRLRPEDRAAIGRLLLLAAAWAEFRGGEHDPAYRADAERLAALAEGGASCE